MQGGACAWCDLCHSVPHPTHLPPSGEQNGKWRRNNNVTVTERYRKRVVPSVDAAVFLADLAASSDFVALKLDVEGFEFTLLPTLLRPEAHPKRHVCALDVLATEWHERMMPAAHAGATARLHDQLRGPGCNVTSLVWD